MGFGDAVASAGCSSWRPTNSVKAMKEIHHGLKTIHQCLNFHVSPAHKVISKSPQFSFTDTTQQEL